MKKSLLLLTAALFLGACSPEVKPVIQFIGMAEGNVQSDISKLAFAERFDKTQHELLALVAFSTIQDGTTVEATWFSPDDRSMPLGRTTVVTQSGATIARFTLASREDWQPAPYMLQVRAMKGEGDNMVTATGSLQFFIGMADEEVEDYKEDYFTWQQQSRQMNAAIIEQDALQNSLLEKAKEVLDGDHVSFAGHTDVIGSADPEYVFVDITGISGSVPATSPSVILDGTVHQFLVLNGSGTELISMTGNRNKYVQLNDEELFTFQTDEAVHVSVLTTGTWIFTWTQDEKSCSREMRKEQDAYSVTEVHCR